MASSIRRQVVQFNSEPSLLLARESDVNKRSECVCAYGCVHVCVSSRRSNYPSKIAWLVPSVPLPNVSEMSGVLFPIEDWRIIDEISGFKWIYNKFAPFEFRLTKLSRTISCFNLSFFFMYFSIFILSYYSYLTLIIYHYHNFDYM